MHDFNCYADNVVINSTHVKRFGHSPAWVLGWMYKYSSMRKYYLIQNNSYDGKEVWFYKSQEEFALEADLSLRSLTRSITFFKKQNIILSKRIKGLWWYHLNLQALDLYDVTPVKSKNEQAKTQPAKNVEASAPPLTVEFKLIPSYFNELLYSPTKYVSLVESTSHSQNAKLAESETPKWRSDDHDTIYIQYIHNSNTILERFECILYKWIVKALEKVTGTDLTHGGTFALSAAQLGDFYKTLTCRSPEVTKWQSLVNRSLVQQRPFIVPKIIHYWVKVMIDHHKHTKALSFDSGDHTSFDTMPSIDDLQTQCNFHAFKQYFKTPKYLIPDILSNNEGIKDDYAKQSAATKLCQPRTDTANRIAQQRQNDTVESIRKAVQAIKRPTT